MTEQPPQGPPDGPGPPDEPTPLHHRLDPDRAAGDQPDGPAPQQHRLDPDRAVQEQRRRIRRQLPQPVIDTRPYRWAIGIFGVALVIVISVVMFATHGVASAGVQPGQKLINFAAPVATSNLVGDVNLSKPCQLGYFGGRAVNTCLLERKGPIVLGFFIPGVSNCEHTVDAMQKLSARYPSSQVRFVAVAASSSKTSTAKAVRAHHWTIPVAYDRDGALAQVYGVELCPMLELAVRGGKVKSLLFGDKWTTTSALEPKVAALLAAQAKA
jgi:thiol-disulfide isomerase/thioredoxin